MFIIFLTDVEKLAFDVLIVCHEGEGFFHFWLLLTSQGLVENVVYLTEIVGTFCLVGKSGFVMTNSIRTVVWSPDCFVSFDAFGGGIEGLDVAIAEMNLAVSVELMFMQLMFIDGEGMLLGMFRMLLFLVERGDLMGEGLLQRLLVLKGFEDVFLFE